MKQRSCRRDRKQNIRFRRQNRNMSKKEKKKKNADETLEIVRKILDYNKIAQNLFQRASKVDERKSKLKFDKKKNQNQRLKKVLQRG